MILYCVNSILSEYLCLLNNQFIADMKKFISGLIPLIEILLFIALYGVILPVRPLYAPDEFDFILAFQKFFPEMSGMILPRIPAALGTLLTGLVIWFCGKSLKLRYPDMAAAFFLLFPPTWFYGTSASLVPVFVFAVSLIAFGIFCGRREKALWKKLLCFTPVIPAALSVAGIVQAGFLSVACVVLSFVPIASLSLTAYLERLNDRGKASYRIDRFVRLAIILLVCSIILLLIPPFCRHFKWNCPASLIIYQPGESIFRPALSMLIPILWLFTGLSVKEMSSKISFIVIAAIFLLLTLPLSLPWERQNNFQLGKSLAALKPELTAVKAVYFADSQLAGALSYELQLPVKTVGRSRTMLSPGELKKQIESTLPNSDVIVALSTNEYDSYLPKHNKTEYLSSGKYRIIRFSKSGGIK